MSAEASSERRTVALDRPHRVDQIIAEIDSAQAVELARRHRLTYLGSQELALVGSSGSG